MKVLLRIVIIVFLCSTCLSVYVGFQLSRDIRKEFDGPKWEVPASVYARSLELYPGMNLSPDEFEAELLLGNYRKEVMVTGAGGFSRGENTFDVQSRAFNYSSGPESSRRFFLHFAHGMVEKIGDSKGNTLPYIMLDPVKIGNFHPFAHEDRVIVDDTEIPTLLKKTLQAVEDRNFYNHFGISLRGISRAFFENMKAGRTVQGGSTLTQQLVKNFFLQSERTLSRKIREAAMAVLLEFHYSKDAILTAYINEIFLGQDGKRAIHGFGLASEFYFKRNLSDITPDQIATLVGMIKGPSLYDPRKNERKCLARRQVVLDIMLREGLINRAVYQESSSAALLGAAQQTSGFNRFPMFMERVRRELKREYREEDLRAKGLVVLTTLDPLVQQKAEMELKNTFTELQKRTDTKLMEAGIVITTRETGEIEAILGGKEPFLKGFNRALDAKRPIGSLVKPAVYLTALDQGYTLASPLEDKLVTLKNDGKPWRPHNYDRQEHGRVALYEALANSYNLATVQLGLELGLENVQKTISSLGFQGSMPDYPSLFLGSVAMAPIEVAQCYQTIASGGFFQPLRSIREVLSTDGKLLTRYGLQVEQRFQPEVMYLLMHNLQRVVTEGSAKSLQGFSHINPAGKTGTTDQNRDSWFAGYTGKRLCVVWLGNDENKPIGLSGAGGALQVWGKIMESLGPKPLTHPEPSGIVWRRIDRQTLRRASLFNTDSTVLPFR